MVARGVGHRDEVNKVMWRGAELSRYTSVHHSGCLQHFTLHLCTSYKPKGSVICSKNNNNKKKPARTLNIYLPPTWHSFNATRPPSIINSENSMVKKQTHTQSQLKKIINSPMKSSHDSIKTFLLHECFDLMSLVIARIITPCRRQLCPLSMLPSPQPRPWWVRMHMGKWALQIQLLFLLRRVLYTTSVGSAMFVSWGLVSN